MEGTRDLYFTHGNGSGCRSDYYAEAIAWAKAQGIAAGYDDGSFGPDDGCQRGQGVTMLYHAHYNNLLTK